MSNTSTDLEFTLPIEPVAQGRPRFVRRGKFVHAYDPQKSRVYKSQVASYIKQRYDDELIDCPVSIDYIFARPYKKSFTKKQKQLSEEGLIYPSTKPDLDNYIKSTQDALIGSVLKDDNIVIETSATKEYSPHGYVYVHIKGMV